MVFSLVPLWQKWLKTGQNVEKINIEKCWMGQVKLTGSGQRESDDLKQNLNLLIMFSSKLSKCFSFSLSQ